MFLWQADSEPMGRLEPMWRVSSLSVNSALVNSVRHSPLLCQDLKGRGSVKFSEDLWGTVTAVKAAAAAGNS